MIITITEATRGRVKIECDTPVYCDVVSLDSAKKREQIAGALKIDANWLIGKAPGIYPYDTTPQVEPLTVTVRDMYSREGEVRETADPVTAVLQAVQLKDTPFLNPIVEWEGTGNACFLDVDYHHVSTPPSSGQLEFVMARIQPQPVFWFESRSGGIHAYYIKQQGVPGDVLAAVASFSYRTLEPVGTFDIIPRSRLSTRPVHVCSPTSDLSAARRFLTAGIDEAAVDNWLSERGIERGSKRDHSFCPAHPTEPSTGEPVWFGENGVRCHRCESKGIMLGSRYPGFFPYATVIGSHTSNDVATMVKNFTHYTHAEVVLDAKCRLKGKHARLAYEGMLRLVHGNDDERVAHCFAVGEHLLRGVGKWVTPDRYETISDCRSTLATLPAVCSKSGKPRPERLDLFDNTVDLSRYGYVPIQPLHGMRVFGEYLGNESSTVSVVLPPVTLPPTLHPRYVPADQRLDLSIAWDRVEQVFPGLNRNYLLLLLAARGVAESESGMPANIMCVGPSSTGKSSLALLAASILGDGCSEAPWVRDEDRFRQKYMAACDKGMFVVVNEVFKSARAARVPPRTAMDTFLNITPGSLSHAMYVGAVPLGRLPVTIATDTYVPPDVRSDIQLGRRFVYVRLDARRDWVQNFMDSGMGQDCNFRALGPDQAEACNAIASYVIDRWFSDKLLPLAKIAEDLDFSTLENSDEVMEDPDALPRLFDEVCKATEYTDPRHKGRGWVKIGMEDETELKKAWEAVCDGTHNYESFVNSRKATSTDMSTVLPVPVGTVLEHNKASNRSVVIRFKLGKTRGGGVYYVNEELRTAPGERR